MSDIINNNLSECCKNTPDISEKQQSNAYSYYTKDRIEGDLNYARAQAIGEKMLSSGLISKEEFIRLTAINRDVFCPLFSEIMSEIT